MREVIGLGYVSSSDAGALGDSGWYGDPQEIDTGVPMVALCESGARQFFELPDEPPGVVWLALSHKVSDAAGSYYVEVKRDPNEPDTFLEAEVYCDGWMREVQIHRGLCLLIEKKLDGWAWVWLEYEG